MGDGEGQGPYNHGYAVDQDQLTGHKGCLGRQMIDSHQRAGPDDHGSAEYGQDSIDHHNKGFGVALGFLQTACANALAHYGHQS